jgi:hypothetical protein
MQCECNNETCDAKLLITQTDGGPITYAVWDEGEEFRVIVKTPDGMYHKRYTALVIGKHMVAELNKLLLNPEN